MIKFPEIKLRKVIIISYSKKTGRHLSLIFILMLFSSLVYCQQKDSSLLSQKNLTPAEKPKKHTTYSNKAPIVFKPDSADYARAALVADTLIHFTLDKLQILSNIDNEGKAIHYFDKIITFDNEVLVVKVQQITLTEVRFLYPYNTRVESINRQNVSQILYSDDRIDLFIPYDEEKKELLPIQEDRLIVYHREIWEKIVVTEDEDEVAGLELAGPVSAVYEAGVYKSTNQYLEKNGMIILKKRAAKLNADYILITNKSFHKGYGDPPSVKIEGLAYKKLN